MKRFSEALARYAGMLRFIYWGVKVISLVFMIHGIDWFHL